ncbi:MULTISPECIES: Rieske 2Fe-2S domain-containing protein [unclassified Cupriavidus]|uniref:Rieske 2Fe-2S domain-containing protein n=1 Tax=unclassified Cupriavidus TaxID=2640874 RepID=UPI001AE5AC3A|nr:MULTISPECIES: Rieske 2Fe-2S domain-containing protein [unclassified Cupriavidus]MBP0632910.1 Rieske 2Fe-2S domain-containing protein [Cupriavidus sp. AcVe19-1a]MBP0639541.1 Rieske 2Fe-2S domain-containing protein [Cupriavidus sp. AcVe19-6a]
MTTTPFDKHDAGKTTGGSAAKTNTPVVKKLIPFGGYYTNRVPDHDPELTETGPGTPMGEYMRRFWHPVCMSMELTDTPRFLKILNEELVAFRDGSGRVGVLHAHCCHRGASLEYGAIQERGIKCCYHGMVFDVDGACLHVPFPEGEEKEAEKYACSIRQGAYKAIERNGLVFAYMGPPEEEPPFPEWEQDFTVLPTDELVAYSNFQHCNWLQVQDNAADNFHPTALHAAKNVVGGKFQSTTFDEVGAASMEVAPDMQFIPVHGGRGLACAGARRVDKDKMFLRIQHQVLPNLSLHAYTSEDGSQKKLFSRFHIIRWTVPVDDENSKMIGWRVMGPGIDTRGVGDKRLVGYESIDFLDGQVAMRRPERFGKYTLEDMPPIPSNHRERENYKNAQYAPGDYEAIISQRPIAVHSLENPTKFDAGLFAFRKMLRDAVRGNNAAAAAQGFAEWLREVSGAPNSYCSGNVFELPQADTMEQEVANRRLLARKAVAILTEADSLKGEARAAFVKAKFDELEQSLKA